MSPWCRWSTSIPTAWCPLTSAAGARVTWAWARATPWWWGAGQTPTPRPAWPGGGRGSPGSGAPGRRSSSRPWAGTRPASTPAPPTTGSASAGPGRSCSMLNVSDTCEVYSGWHCPCSDSPHIVSLSPSGSVSGQVGSRVSLSCEAEANPPPAYQWVQKLSDQYVIRGNSRVLILDNIIFEVRANECMGD